MTATAFANAELMRRIGGPAPIVSLAALAAEFNRDPSNLRKTLKALESEGLIIRPEAERPTLTDLGRQVLRGVDTAEGLNLDGDPSPAPVATRWPIDRIRRNPANRDISVASVLDMIDAVVGFGDIIQPLTLTPPDANGVRTILAGERRWRATAMLSGALGDAALATALERTGGAGLPEPLREGLPFVEREADDATAILITIVENSAREDLSPWDDAQQLLRLADATGWSGAEVARRTGRLSETKKNGAKDVTDKLRIAREATPDQIADYHRTGSWDGFRDRVLRRGAYAPDAPPADDIDPDQLAMFEDVGEQPLCTFVPGQPYKERFDRHNPAQTVGDVAPHLNLELRSYLSIQDAAEPGSIETLALPWTSQGQYYPRKFPQAQIQIAQVRGAQAWVSSGGYALSDIGNHNRLSGVSATTPAHPDRRTALMAAIDDIAEGITRNKNGRVPPAIAEWLQNPTAAGPHVVDFVEYRTAERADAARGAVARPVATPSAPTPVDLSPLARLALVELTIKIKRLPVPTGDQHDPGRMLSGADLPGAWRTYGAPVGAHWSDPYFAELAKAGFVRAVHRKGGLPTLATLTDAGVAYMGDDLPPTMATHGVALQAATGSLAPPKDRSYVTDWLEFESTPPTPLPAPQPLTPAEQAACDLDDFGRDADAIAADAALLGDVLALYHDAAEEPDEAAARALMARLNIAGPFEEDGDGGLIAQVDGNAEALAFIDVDRTLPDDRSRAAALLIAWACRVVFGAGAAA